ncbi:MAG: Fe/S biosis protein NfuA [Thermoleophilaceae bacterium]|jgi:Fe/S biogenesis protein NfuA|nr:Fe/S biosis protein NfuA [Thermoleophilaceae bacterium]
MDEPLIQLSDTARDKVEGFRAGVEDSEGQAMWVEVTGVHRGEFTYNLSLKPLSSAGPDDALHSYDGLPVVVPARDVEALRGAAIDWSDDLNAGGLVVANPNTPSPVVEGGAPDGLTGDVAQRVAQVIDRQINPAIAQHGGMAQLERVENGTAFVRLGGGCQGCGMATVTLDQGIESAILQAVPEVQRVVDVTDHASGTDPYFQPAPA